MISPKPVIPGEDVGREIASGHVAEMEGRIGIGPGNANENPAAF
jgi:hypothetical protein